MTEDVRRKKEERVRMDYSIVSIVVLLVIFGLLVIYSASYYSAEQTFSDKFYYLRRQAIYSFIGIFLMIIVSLFDYKRIVNEVFAWGGIAISVVLMLLVNFSPLGVELNGRRRWIGLGGFTFQPTEFVKVAVIIFCAYYINKYLHGFERKKKLGIFLGAAALPTALIAQNNLSSGIIIVLIVFVIFAVSCHKDKKLYVIIGIITALGLAAVFFGQYLVDMGWLKKYQFSRIGVWKDPTAYSEEGGYQVLQGLYAIGSGGFFGKGFGASTQKLGYVPEAQNDMIFSIICEELGIFGAFCLMAIFAILIYKLVRVAMNANDLVGTLIATGVATHLSLQVLLNIGVVTNSIPNTGVSLPFISYGGSSVIFLLLEMGIVLSVANRIPRRKRQGVKKREKTH